MLGVLSQVLHLHLLLLLLLQQQQLRLLLWVQLLQGDCLGCGMDVQDLYCPLWQYTCPWWQYSCAWWHYNWYRGAFLPLLLLLLLLRWTHLHTLLWL
jgi:hypothetical protein